MPEWNYATLSKVAKEFGGPEQLIATITKNASKSGIYKGVTIGTTGTLVGIMAYKAGTKKVKAIIAKRKQEKAEAEKAESELIKKLHEQEHIELDEQSNLDSTELNSEDNYTNPS